MNADHLLHHHRWLMRFRILAFAPHTDCLRPTHTHTRLVTTTHCPLECVPCWCFTALSLCVCSQTCGEWQQVSWAWQWPSSCSAGSSACSAAAGTEASCSMWPASSSSWEVSHIHTQLKLILLSRPDPVRSRWRKIWWKIQRYQTITLGLLSSGCWW